MVLQKVYQKQFGSLPRYKCRSKLPENALVIAEEFLEDMKQIGKISNLANMVETPCYFDKTRNETFNRCGVSTAKVKTKGYERLRFTVCDY